MQVIILGTGTSQGIPIIGCTCMTCQSDDPRDSRLRTSAYIKKGDFGILIDIGPDFRQQALHNQIKRVDAVMLTHEHNDHIMGLDDIRPFNFMQQNAIPVYGLKRVISDIKNKFGYIFEEFPYPGAPRIDCHEIKPNENFHLTQDIIVQTIHVLHGDLPILGFRIENFGYVTDASYLDSTSIDKLRGVDVLILDCLRFRKHYSHFCYEEALEIAREIGAERTYFTHMSHELGPHADFQKNMPPGIQPAYDGLIIDL